MSLSVSGVAGKRDAQRAVLDRAGRDVGERGTDICMDGMLFHGDAEMRANDAGIRRTTSSYRGLTIGAAGW